MLRASHCPSPAMAASPKPRTEMTPKGTAPSKTLSVPIRPLKWAQSGYFTEEIAGGFKDLIVLWDLWTCRLGMGWSRKERCLQKANYPTPGWVPALQTLCLPSLSSSATARHLENIKSSQRGWERGRRALHRSLLSFGADRVVPLQYFEAQSSGWLLRSWFCWEAESNYCL